MRRAEEFMRRALGLARRGLGRVEPNPLVGCVVARGREIVGSGCHRRYGGAHAEVAALAQAGEKARGADVYVTLEPCGHEGKTPPCAEVLVKVGVARVFYAAADPNPITAGTGPERLEESGILVEGGLLAGEARGQNARYESHLAADVPWTVAKWAMTLDGKIADVDGGSRSVTGKRARGLVHEIRGAVDAVVVGARTALTDDPDLTPRGGRPTRRPVRLVVDTRLSIPSSARLVRTARGHPTWIATGPDPDPEKLSALERAGCRVLRNPVHRGRVDLSALFVRLRSEGLLRVLLEGGGALLASAFSAGVVRQVMAFSAPVILGGRDAPTPVDGEGLRRVAEPLSLQDVRVRRLGPDILVEGFIAF